MRVKLGDGSYVICKPNQLGHGAVGTVYEVDGDDQVVKLFRNPSPGLERALALIIDDYSQVATGDWAPLYRWPNALVTEPGLGVRTPMIPPEFAPLSWLLMLKALASKPPSWRSWQLRVAVASSIAMAVGRLHLNGLAHSDLSPKNIWIHPRDGRITLIDIDGLVVPGVVAAQVVGTPEYIAPEVLVSAARPSIAADLHSLAVILYQLLLYRHPLRGPKMFSSDPSIDAMRTLGPDGTYVDHPADDSNRPTAEEGDGFWPTRLLGAPLVTLFERAFVDGMREPGERPQAAEWANALTRLADRVVTCSGTDCPEGAFPISDGVTPTCPWCHTKLALDAHMPALHLYQAVANTSHFEPDRHWWIAGNAGRKVHIWHTEKAKVVTPSSDRRAMAEVELHDGVWSLRNHRLPQLQLIRAGRVEGTIGIGDRAVLYDGATLMLAPPPGGRAIVVNRLEHG